MSPKLTFTASPHLPAATSALPSSSSFCWSDAPIFPIVTGTCHFNTGKVASAFEGMMAKRSCFNVKRWVSPSHTVSAITSGTPSCSVKDAAIALTCLPVARSSACQRSAVVALL
jgi:hypothetical protein